jgi:hypothetical protein
MQTLFMNRNLLTAILTFATLSASAQLYFKGGVGYAFPQAGQTIDGGGNPIAAEANYTFSASAEHDDFKMKKASFSSGGSFIVGAGYMFTKNLGVELNANLGLMPKKYTTKLSGTFNSPQFENTEIRQHAKMPVILSPSLVLQTGGDKMNIYMRGGFALPIASKIMVEEQYVYNDGSGTQTEKFDSEITSGLSIGFSGAAGLKYKLSKHLSIWGECSLLSLSMYVKKQELKVAEINGMDMLFLIDPEDQVINFKSEYSTDDPSNSNVRATYSIPFSNVGINAGVTFSL